MEVVSLSESVSPTTRKRSISFSFTPDNNNNTTTNHAAAAKLDAVAKAKCAELNKDSPLKRRRRQRLLNVASCSSDSVAQQHFVLLAQLSHTPRHQFATANSNVLKNRYPNILANESTRVRLARSNAASLSLSLLQTDYINANHIQLDNSPSKFILVCRFPLVSRFFFFFRLDFFFSETSANITHKPFIFPNFCFQFSYKYLFQLLFWLFGKNSTTRSTHITNLWKSRKKWNFQLIFFDFLIFQTLELEIFNFFKIISN